MSCIFWKLLFRRSIYKKHFLSILRGVRSLLTQWDAYVNSMLHCVIQCPIKSEFQNVAETLVVFPRMSSIDWIYLIYSEWIRKYCEYYTIHRCQIRWKIQEQNSSSWYSYPLQTNANHGKINLSVMALRSCTYGPLICPWMKIICIRIGTTET